MTARSQSIVIDTNVLVSAFLFPGSIPALAVSLAQRSSFVLASSESLLELAEILLRPKFDAYVSTASRVRCLVDYKACVKVVEVTENVRVSRDPKDDMMLELALAGEANTILTGDKDLLSLHPWRAIEILTPADYLAR